MRHAGRDFGNDLIAEIGLGVEANTVFIPFTHLGLLRPCVSAACDISQTTPNSGKSYHQATTKGTASLSQPSDGLISGAHGADV